MCASYMIQTMVHTRRGRGCSIFIEINVKRQSNPPSLTVCNILRWTAHTSIQPSKIILKYDFESVYHICTTGGVIRVLKEMGDLNRELYSNYFNALLISRSTASPHVHVQYVQCTNLQATAVRGAVISQRKSVLTTSCLLRNNWQFWE